MLAAQQRSGRLGPATREKFKNTGATARGRMPRTEFFCAVWWCMCTATEAYIPPQYTAFLLSLLTSKQTSEAVCPMDDQTGSLSPLPPTLPSSREHCMRNMRDTDLPRSDRTHMV